MKQFEFHSAKCCQQAQKLVSKSNNVLLKSQQLHLNSEKRFRLLEQLLCDSNESLGTTGEISSGLDRSWQMIGPLQTDINQRLQTFTQLQFNLDKCFEKVSLLIENTDLNISANDSFEATTDLTDTKNVLAKINSMIKKLEIGNWEE